jgi:hypothetical protein
MSRSDGNDAKANSPPRLNAFCRQLICKTMIRSKLARQTLKRNDLTGQADAHRWARVQGAGHEAQGARRKV